MGRASEKRDIKEENEDYKIDKLECTLKRRTNIVKEIIKIIKYASINKSYRCGTAEISRS